MRPIQIEHGLRLRFPGRDEAFNEGVEIGLLAAALAAGRTEFTLHLAHGTLAQARELATRMGYRVHVVQADEVWTEATFRTGSKRPKLTLVRTAAG